MAKISPAQLSEWFQTHGAMLLLYVRQWLGRAEAEDAVQEVFCRLMTLSAEPDCVKAWLIRAVRNEAITRVRSRQRRRRREQQVAAERPDWFTPRPDDLLDAATVQTGLETLPTEQREVIVLRIWAEMSFREISELTDASISTLHSRYQAGLTALRKKMGTPCKTNHN